MEERSDQKRLIIAALFVLVVIGAVIAGAGLAANKNSNDNADLGASSQQTSNTDSATDTTGSSTVTTTGSLKDGTYEGSGSYSTPGGVDEINVKLTINNGTISEVSASTVPPDNESEEFDDQFLLAYQQEVIGKSLKQLSLSRVSGASLTTEGFLSALQQIATKAQA